MIGPTSDPSQSGGSPKSPKILWVSNAPWVPSGYGIQTKLFVPRLKALGYDLSVLCTSGLDHGLLNWNGIPCYPRGRGLLSQDVTGAAATQSGADVILTLFDAWAASPQLYGGSAYWVPYFPVDSEPIPKSVEAKVKHSLVGITYSRFGQREAQSVGLDVLYVPHGIETAVYRPIDQATARASAGLPNDRFIVGMVAMNKDFPCRKSFPQVLEAFAEFRRRHKDALLYIHTIRGGPSGGEGSVDLPAICEDLGISDVVRFPEPYLVSLGFRDTAMVDIFNSFDVLLSPSMGEGFGLPIIEAQACGKPVIVGEWTAMGELCGAGVCIPRVDAERFWTASRAYQFIPRVGAIVDALESIYASASRGSMATAARAHAERYDVDFVTEEYWRPVLSRVFDLVAERESSLVPVSAQAASDPGGERSEAAPHGYLPAISIITPWLDHPELIAEYEAAVLGAEVIIIDNGSTEENAEALKAMVRRVGGLYIRNETNRWFSAACNQGLRVARGEMAMFLNNDVFASPGWLRQVLRDCRRKALHGPSLSARTVDGVQVPYLEGWCIAASREDLLALGGFDEVAFPMPYWEDNDLSFRARQRGFDLVETNWGVSHLGGSTSTDKPEATARLKLNRDRFESRVRAAHDEERSRTLSVQG